MRLNDLIENGSADHSAYGWFRRRFGEDARHGEPMSQHTSLCVGGPAEIYFVPRTAADLRDAVQYARESRLPYLVVGTGTNLLVRDEGIRGLVISLSRCSQGIDRAYGGGNDVALTVGGGASLQALCRYAVENGLGGANFAQGIPGTIGGGIHMNAGTDLGQMGDILKGVSVMHPEGQIRAHGEEDLRFGYRSFSLGSRDWTPEGNQPILLSGTFALTAAEPQDLRHEARSIIEDRWRKQPLGHPSAGSFFKNPQGEKPAGALIEMAGLKGRRIGGAAVSEKHANFLINTGSATAADFLALMETVQETVASRFAVDLDVEVTIVGP